GRAVEDDELARSDHEIDSLEERVALRAERHVIQEESGGHGGQRAGVRRGRRGKQVHELRQTERAGPGELPGVGDLAEALGELGERGGEVEEDEEPSDGEVAPT